MNFYTETKKKVNSQDLLTLWIKNKTNWFSQWKWCRSLIVNTNLSLIPPNCVSAMSAVLCLQWLVLDDLQWILLCVCVIRNDSFPFLSYSLLLTFFIQNWVTSVFNIAKRFSSYLSLLNEVALYLLLSSCTSTIILPNVKNVLGNCHDNMQNFLVSHFFKHWFSDVLEECLHECVCSWCLQ